MGNKLEVLQVSTINEQGKTTVPKSIRKINDLIGKKGKMIWYRNNEGDCVIEIKPKEDEEL